MKQPSLATRRRRPIGSCLPFPTGLARPVVILALGTILLSTAACQSTGSEPPADPAATSDVAPAPSAAESSAAGQATRGNSRQTFIAACLSSTNMGQALCTCVAEKAESELSRNGYDFLVATLRDDDAAADRLRSQLTIQEATEAATFLTRGPRDCAAEGV